MTSLRQAVQTAEERKGAAFGDAEGLVFSRAELDRAIFSGFDIDHDELSEVATMAARYFCHLAPNVPLGPLFTSAWVEGLLVGLIASRQFLPPPTPDEGMDSLAGE